MDQVGEVPVDGFANLGDRVPGGRVGQEGQALGVAGGQVEPDPAPEVLAQDDIDAASGLNDCFRTGFFV